MAVDRQQIINSLGNIVNQLQSADCGCLGKVFSNPGQGNPNSQCPGTYHGNQGYQNNLPCSGEPYSGGRCFGGCNPTKLFADTYNYLKPNLMQPVVQEVYNDLKSINPQNTIMNNMKGAQMGLPAGTPNPGQGNPMAQNAMPGGLMGTGNNAPQNIHGHAHHMPHLHFGNVDMNAINQNNPRMGQEIDQGMNQGMGQGMGQMSQNGPGMGGMEHNMTQRGNEMNYMGHGTGQMGHEMDQMGQGMGHMVEGGHMGHGMGHMGHGMERAGHGMDHTSLTGQVGLDGGHMGQRMAQMGQGAGQIGHPMGEMGQGMGQMGQGMGQMGQGMGEMGQGTGQGMGHQMHPSGGMAGMGPQIVNMMYGSSKPNYQQNQGGPPNATGNAIPQSLDMGPMPGDAHQGQFDPAQMQNAGYMGGNSMPQGDTGMQGNQFMTQPNMHPGATANAQGNVISGDMKQMNSRPQRMGHTNNYGIHNAGMNKFNEMFSSMMKGDLGFDPMAIAIQMNPANEKRSAINNMQKFMMGDSRHHPRLGQQTNLPQANLTAGLREMVGTQQQQQRQPGDATERTLMQNNQQVYNAQGGATTMNQQMSPQQMNIQEQQMQQQQWPQQSQEPLDQAQQEGYQQQHIADPNSEGVVSRTLPTVYEGYPNVRPQTDPAIQHLYREPIFPADTSRHLLQSHHFAKPQKFYDYNTLGQPVEVLPAKRYRIPVPDLPQTLSPEPGRYSNVKNTVSKTALIANKPDGKTPSRTQLQRVYNTYKGSQSFTQQNIKPDYTGSYSMGHIHVPADRHHPHPQQQAYVERVSGDTEANNRYPEKENPNMENDLVAAKKADHYPVGKNFKLRNGLQDQVFTSSPTSAKWTFHGSGGSPFSAGYQYNKIR